MKFVLIGGAGYIGSQLTRALDSRGFTVTVIDNFTYNQNTYFPPSVNVVKDDIENIKTHQADIASADYVFFMASPRLNEINDLPQPLPYLDALKDTVELLGEKTQLVFFSSCSVYGYQANEVNETSPTRITSLYSKLKIDSENILIRKGDDRLKIVRLSTLYGLSSVSRNDLLINNFIKDITFSKYLEVYDPLSWRPNIYLDDLVNILIDLSENRNFLPILNIGFNKLNTTKQDLILTLVTKNKFDFIVKYYAPQDSRSYKVNFDLVESLIHFKDYTTYEAGIYKIREQL